METAFLSGKAFAIVVAVALVSATLVAGCRNHRCRGHGTLGAAEIQERVNDHLDFALWKIGATAEQKARILALKDRLMPDLLSLRESHEATAREAAALWSAPSLDASALDELVDRRAEELRAVAHRLAQGAAELHAILTPEQRQRLAALHERRGEP